MAITPRLKDKITQPENMALLKAYQFNKYYEQFITYEKSDITYMLQELGVEPIKYFKEFIPDFAYFANAHIKNVDINDDVTSIGRSAFSNSQLESVNFDNASNLKIIHNCAFERTELKKLALPSNVPLIAIGDYAFYECANIQSIALPEGLSKIGKCCFDGCENASIIHLPKGVANISAYAFRDCGYNSHSLIVYYSGTSSELEVDAAGWHSSAFDKVTEFQCTDKFYGKLDW